MKEKEDIMKQLSDPDTIIQKAMEQMSDSFAINEIRKSEFTEEFFQEGQPGFSGLSMEIDVEKTE